MRNTALPIFFLILIAGLTSCVEEKAQLDVTLTYASGEIAEGVLVQLFSSELDFKELNEKSAQQATSNAEGQVSFTDLDVATYWIWAKIGTRSEGGKAPLSSGSNKMEMVLK